MDKLFASSMQQGTIFRNQHALMPEFLPTTLLHRDNQLTEMAEALKPAMHHSKPQNLLIHGPTGTGKTSSVKYVFNELKEYSSKVQCIYLNCWEHPSKQSILSYISEQLKEPLPRRGLADDEIFHRILERLKYDKKIAVICLDEVDRLLHKNETDLLYNLSRSDENSNVIFGIIGITNAPEIFYSLDDRIRSSIGFKELEFRQYSPIELKDIVRERAKEALQPGSYNEEIVALCAAHGAKNKGDARVAIETLLRAATNADNRDKNKVEITDVRAVVEKSAQASLMKNVDLMGENEKILLELLKTAKREDKILTSGEIYLKFNKLRKSNDLEPISERQIMNYLQMFESARLISAELAKDPRTGSGKTKLIKLIR
ncbi:MAG: AAA family ATPase [Candidatus Micrarchaeota archaeon]